MCMLGKSHGKDKATQRPLLFMTLPRHPHSSPPRVASFLPRDRRWSLPGQTLHSGRRDRLFSLVPPSKSSSISRDEPTATQDTSKLLVPHFFPRVPTIDPKASSLEPLFSTSETATNAQLALSTSSFDGATLNVETTFASEDTVEALTGRHIQVCDFCHQQGLMPLSSRQQQDRRREDQRSDYFQASPATVPWPSSDDSVMPPPTWSSKSTLQNHLTRRRSQSLPSNRRPIDALFEEADTDSEHSTPLDAGTDSCSDLGATVGTNSTRNFTATDCGEHVDPIKESRTKKWLSSSDTVGSRPSTLTSLHAPLSRGSLASFATQGASNSLVNLAILTFCSFTLFLAFYTLIEMRDLFALTLAEVTSIKTLVVTRSETSRAHVEQTSLDRIGTGILFSPWLETIIAVWLTAVAGLTCIVVWEFCPNTIWKLQARFRELKW